MTAPDAADVRYRRHNGNSLLTATHKSRQNRERSVLIARANPAVCELQRNRQVMWGCKARLQHPDGKINAGLSTRTRSHRPRLTASESDAASDCTCAVRPVPQFERTRLNNEIKVSLLFAEENGYETL